MLSGLPLNQNLNQSVTTVDPFNVLEGNVWGPGVVVGEHKCNAWFKQKFL